MFEIGLIVGKFSPLHKGHKHLIDTAAKQCNKLIVICYSNPELKKCKSAVRAKWLQDALHGINSEFIVIDEDNVFSASGFESIPHNDALAKTHRFFCFKICEKYFKTQVDAIFTSEEYGDGFAEYFNKFYSEEFNIETSVKHICVDIDRLKVPISATEIRNDMYEHQNKIDKMVFADLIPKILIVGGESTGKSTLVRELASLIKMPFTVEFGRVQYDVRKGNLKYQDMLYIAKMQTKMEHDVALFGHINSSSTAIEKTVLICDTGPLTTYFYANELFNGHVDPELVKMAHNEYDAVIICENDFGFVQDGTRKDISFQEKGQQFYKNWFIGKDIPLLEVSGSVETRVNQSIKFLKSLQFI